MIYFIIIGKHSDFNETARRLPHTAIEPKTLLVSLMGARKRLDKDMPDCIHWNQVKQAL
jgi:hypothetical protein